MVNEEAILADEGLTFPLRHHCLFQFIFHLYFIFRFFPFSQKVFIKIKYNVKLKKKIAFCFNFSG